jgi:hypothetical protein
MREIGDGYKSRLEFVLDQACAELPYGGDHKSRQFIAGQLLEAVRAGTANFEDLNRVAQRALAELVSTPNSA